MKKEHSVIEKRREEIYNTIRIHGEISVSDLSDMYGVSLMTIRRDLNHLEDKRLITHLYGKASIPMDSPEYLAGGNVMFCREQIAKYASRYINNGDTIFINGSSTALKMLEFVSDRKLSVYTNNAKAIESAYPPNITLNLTGGEVRGHVMVGEYVMKNLLNMYADKTFIGCAALYNDGEFRYDIPTEIGINEAMISRTKKELYMLADHTKIHRHTDLDTARQYGSCIYDYPMTLITDDQADPMCIEQIKETGINVIQVSTRPGQLNK